MAILIATASEDSQDIAGDPLGGLLVGLFGMAFAGALAAIAIAELRRSPERSKASKLSLFRQIRRYPRYSLLIIGIVFAVAALAATQGAYHLAAR